MILREFVFPLLFVATPLVAAADGFKSRVDPTLLRSEKTTPQMQYLTSEEAYTLLLEEPGILFVDVRDPVEVMLHGHPETIDAIVPVQAQSTVFDDRLMEWELKDNPNFVMYMEDALTHFGKTKSDMIIVTCGSGWRSAQAATLLHEAGFTNVWHIPDGYAGDDKPGLNLANAWQLAGLPWSHDRVYGSDRLQVIK